jgi:hypothetical protein
MVDFLGRIPKESIVDVIGVLVKPKEELKTCSIKMLELQIHKIFLVNSSLPKLPF